MKKWEYKGIEKRSHKLQRLSTSERRSEDLRLILSLLLAPIPHNAIVLPIAGCAL